MKKKISIGKYLSYFCVAVLVISVFGCKDELKDKVFTTATGKSLGDYMKSSPDTFSEFYKILEKTNSVTFLNAYGSYTLFAPNNAAVRAWVQSEGKNSVDDFTSEQDINLLKSLIRLHLVNDTISSDQFVEGGLADTTMSGNILSTEFGAGGINDITVCKIAKIVRRDIKTINGIIHVIDKVLSPEDFSRTVYQRISENPDYSIFAEALLKTGISDSLNISSYPDYYGNPLPYRYTVFAEPNSVYNQKQITSYDDLLAKFSNTKNPYKNPKDSLYLLMANHCIRNSTPYFLRDFSNQNYLSMGYDFLTISVNQKFLINLTFEVNQTLSNNVSKNGVFHTLDSMLVFKVVPPAPLYWDIFEKWPVFTNATDNTGKKFFRTQSLSFPNTYFPNGLPTIRVGKNIPNGGTNYQYSNGDNYAAKDHLEVPNLPGIDWIELDVPSVNAGTYNVWVCAKCKSGRAAAYVLVDGKMIGTVETAYQAVTDAAKHNLDSKTYDNIDLSHGVQGSQYVGVLAGTVSFSKTATHVIRFKSIPNPGTNLVLSLDMIHIIPVDMDQKKMTFPNVTYPLLP